MTTITVPRAVLEKALEALEAMKAEFRALDLPYGSKAYAAGNQAAHGLRAALAQQEQEPVAWRSQNATPPGGFVIFQQYPQALADLGGVIEPLYTAPPRREWKGLKEWEINDGRDQLPTEDLCNWSFRQGVYFAEAKLKEKNNG